MNTFNFNCFLFCPVPSSRPLEMLKPLGMTTAVALESTFRSVSAETTTSSEPTWERICWRSLGSCFRSVESHGRGEMLWFSVFHVCLLHLYCLCSRLRMREIITSSISSVPRPVYQSSKTSASVSSPAFSYLYCSSASTSAAAVGVDGNRQVEDKNFQSEQTESCVSSPDLVVTCRLWLVLTFVSSSQRRRFHLHVFGGEHFHWGREWCWGL